jgi:hypothetical protein
VVESLSSKSGIIALPQDLDMLISLVLGIGDGRIANHRHLCVTASHVVDQDVKVFLSVHTINSIHHGSG